MGRLLLDEAEAEEAGKAEVQAEAGDVLVEAYDGTVAFKNLFLEQLPPATYADGVYNVNFTITLKLENYALVAPLRTSYFTVQVRRVGGNHGQLPLRAR